ENGLVWVTVRAGGNCRCEYTPPGGGQTAACPDLGGGMYDPIDAPQTCASATIENGGVTIERTAWGISYEDAEADALAECATAVTRRCIRACALKENSPPKPPNPHLLCCQPRTE